MSALGRKQTLYGRKSAGSLNVAFLASEAGQKALPGAWYAAHAIGPKSSSFLGHAMGVAFLGIRFLTYCEQLEVL